MPLVMCCLENTRKLQLLLCLLVHLIDLSILQFLLLLDTFLSPFGILEQALKPFLLIHKRGVLDRGLSGRSGHVYRIKSPSV